MTAKLLETINDHLAKLHGFAYFRPQEGALRDRLTSMVLDAMPEQAEQPQALDIDIEIGIGRQEEETEATLELRVNDAELVKAPQLTLAGLTDEELADLCRYLAPIAEERAAETTEAEGGAAAFNEEGHHNQASAAARLKVAPEWLKSVIPCTDYSYEEIDGKKYIREYFWSKDLIERLVKIRSTKTTPEDLQYVTKECCDGDQDWAKDLIARLKSPNRPERPERPEQVRDQQKGHGRQGQHGGRGQGQGQGKQPRQQAKGAPGKPPQAQAQAAAAAAAASPAQGNSQPAAAAPEGAGERERRPRSRHRRAFRHQGKETPRKPEAPAGPKTQQ